jgi:hypothetical protein
MAAGQPGMSRLPCPGQNRLFADRMAAVRLRLRQHPLKVVGQYGRNACAACAHQGERLSIYTVGCPRRSWCIPGYWAFEAAAPPPQTLRAAPQVHPRPWRPPAEPPSPPRQAPTPLAPDAGTVRIPE